MIMTMILILSTSLMIILSTVLTGRPDLNLVQSRATLAAKRQGKRCAGPGPKTPNFQTPLVRV